MPFFVFSSETGDDVPTLPEQMLGQRWSESSLLTRVRHVALVLGLSILAVGLYVVVSIM
jgi:hypothetical protein